MGQRIRLKIAGKEYELVAETPEMERLMRLSGEDINRTLDDFAARFPEASPEDKMVIVAVMEGAGRFYAEKELARLKEDIDSLDRQLTSYLVETKEK